MCLSKFFLSFPLNVYTGKDLLSFSLTPFIVNMGFLIRRDRQPNQTKTVNQATKLKYQKPVEHLSCMQCNAKPFIYVISFKQVWVRIIGDCDGETLIVQTRNYITIKPRFKSRSTVYCCVSVFKYRGVCILHPTSIKWIDMCLYISFSSSFTPKPLYCGISDYNISLRCTAYWFTIYIHHEMITVSLVNLHHYT